MNQVVDALQTLDMALIEPFQSSSGNGAYPKPVEVVLTRFPQLRFMGSKFRLIPWLYEVLSELSFDTALDAFGGSGVVGYLLKAMGKSVTTNDFMRFSVVISKALIENPGIRVSSDTLQLLLNAPEPQCSFIHDTFRGIFFTPDDLRFLDRTWGVLRRIDNPYERAVALSALIRSCVKRQPRGVFTVPSASVRYDDGRRDLRLSLREHFVEQVSAYNAAVFDNGRDNRALHGDVFECPADGFDLVYLDPPYVPRSDDNCYIKRYHFLEGLANYWEGESIMFNTKVRKIPKRYTPFSYRRTAVEAFDRLFKHFSSSTLVLSYSSNGYPDLDILVGLMRRYKRDVVVHRHNHRYHFGNHGSVRRAVVEEYLIVGTT